MLLIFVSLLGLSTAIVADSQRTWDTSSHEQPGHRKSHQSGAIGVEGVSDGALAQPPLGVTYPPDAFGRFEEAMKVIMSSEAKFKELLAFMIPLSENNVFMEAFFRLEEEQPDKVYRDRSGETANPDSTSSEGDPVFSSTAEEGSVVEGSEDPVFSSTAEEGSVIEPLHCQKEPLQHPDCIPGLPELDYPTYEDIPETSFTCSDKNRQLYMYADVETGCQVFHLCWRNRKETCLCPIGSTFNQVTLECDYWYKSNCSHAPSLYPPRRGLIMVTAPPNQPTRAEILAALQKKLWESTSEATGETITSIPDMIQTTTEDILNRTPKFPLVKCLSPRDPERTTEEASTTEPADDILDVLERLVKRTGQLVSSLGLNADRSNLAKRLNGVSTVLDQEPHLQHAEIEHPARLSAESTLGQESFHARDEEVSNETTRDEDVQSDVGSRNLRVLTLMLQTLGATLEEEVLPLTKKILLGNGGGVQCS